MRATLITLVITGLIGAVMLIAGCDETQTMIKPVVEGHTVTPENTQEITKVSQMKAQAVVEETPPESTDTEVAEPPIETVEEPADTAPPAVVEISYYSNRGLTKPLTESIPAGKPVFTKVEFANDVTYIPGNDASAFPDIRYVINGTEKRYETQFNVLPIETRLANIKEGDCKPIGGRTRIFLCKNIIIERHSGSEFSVNVGGVPFDDTTLMIEPPPSRAVATVPDPMVPDIEPIPEQPGEVGVIDRNLPDFTGWVYIPEPLYLHYTHSETKPVAGATVTIMAGSRTGENVITNQNGQYIFPNVEGDELHLLVEKDGFEPKEVIVHRFRPTTLSNRTMSNFYEDPQKNPGNILIGHAWPDEVRFILQKTLVVYDLLYVDGGTPSGIDIGGFYGDGVVVVYSELVGRFHGKAGVLGTFAHEIAHAHQHALIAVDGSGDVRKWKDTPEGRAFAEARRKDWEQVGKARYDNVPGYDTLDENAAETCAHYWSVDRWGGRTAYGKLSVEAPNRFKWAEQWLK